MYYYTLMSPTKTQQHTLLITYHCLEIFTELLFFWQQYINLTILSINDVPALEFLVAQAQRVVYLSKDINSAFNALLGPALDDKIKYAFL